jgi:hypothetical protein
MRLSSGAGVSEEQELLGVRRGRRQGTAQLAEEAGQR